MKTDEKLWNVSIKEQEISVIRTNNKHGFESYGWGGADKLILLEDFEDSQRDFGIKLANLACDMLNKEKLIFEWGRKDDDN